MVMQVVGTSERWEVWEDKHNKCHLCSGDGQFSSTGYLDGVITPCKACDGTGEHRPHKGHGEYSFYKEMK